MASRRTTCACARCRSRRTVIDFVKQHERVYVIENNFDGQMWQILRMEIPGDTSNMVSLSLGDTLPMTARWIHTRIFQEESK